MRRTANENKKLIDSLVKSCSDIINKFIDDNVVSCETKQQRINRLTNELVIELVKKYEEETGLTQYEEGTVFISIPINELSAIKESILSAKYPRVTYNDDFELMKLERDNSREVSLSELERWIDEVIK